MEIQLIEEYGLDTLAIALCTVILTGLFKIPVKKLAEKTGLGKKITKFITFLPVFSGFGLTVLSKFILAKQVSFNADFYMQWLSAVSLSLAIYAFWEKFVPSEKKILSESEINLNKAAINGLKEKVFNDAATITAGNELEANETAGKKIILTNNKNLK